MATGTLRNFAYPVSTALYAPITPTNVSTDTTITLDNGYQWNLFSHIIIYFLSNSSPSSNRAMLDITPTAIGAAAFTPIAQGTTLGVVRIGSSDSYNKIRIISTSFSSLYIHRIYGTT